MTLTKIALTVLGTVGLTAGTVLAVAEPVPAQLPEATAKAAGCPKCAAGSCGTAKCTTTAVEAVAATAPKCAAGTGQCEAKSDSNNCPSAAILQTAGEATWELLDDVYRQTGGLKGDVIELVNLPACRDAAAKCCAEGTCSAGGVCNGQTCTEKNCVADGDCPSGTCGQAKKRVTFSFEITSNGPTISLTSANEDSNCATGTCPQSASACAKTTSEVCSKSECACAASACSGGACNAAECPKCSSGKCSSKVQHVCATSCEPSTACAVAACPMAACAAPACREASNCPTEACSATACPDGACLARQTVTEANDFADPVCSVAACDCKECCCETCDCTSNAACPPGTLCPVAARVGQALGQIRAALAPSGDQYVVRWTDPAVLADSREALVPAHELRNYDSYRTDLGDLSYAEAPGRVRLTHLPGLRFLPAGPGPGVLAHSNFLFTSFDAQAAHAAPATPKRNGVEATWTQTVGPYTATFTCENGRISGTWTGREEDGLSARFSGSCSVSNDGQIFGVLDEVDFSDKENPLGSRGIAVQLIDQPFAVRFRLEGNELILKDFRCAGLSPELLSDEHSASGVRQCVDAFTCGRFQRTETN